MKKSSGLPKLLILLHLIRKTMHCYDGRNCKCKSMGYNEIIPLRGICSVEFISQVCLMSN